MIKEKIDRLVYLNKQFEKDIDKVTLDEHLEFLKLTQELKELGVLTIKPTDKEGIVIYHFDDVPDVGNKPTAPGGKL